MKQQGFVRGQVSIVTPVYNGESHLAQMLESVLAQTYSKIEMILADDGSTDRTIQVAESYCKRFADRGYGYRIVRGNHVNASGAMNRGFPYVTGEYLIWPDSDDVLEPESVEKRVRFLEEHPQYQCVRSMSYYFDKVRGVLGRADEKTGDLTKEELFWDILEFKTYVCCGCYMVKTAPFFEIYTERCIPEYPVGQNFQMLLPFMYYHKCPTIQERLYGVFVREGSHSRTVLTQEEEEQKFRDYENLVDEIADICKINDRKSKRRILFWKMKRRYNIARKYGRKWKMINALLRMCLCGEEGWNLAKEYMRTWRNKHSRHKKRIWPYWKYKIKVLRWVLKIKTWMYWRIRKGFAGLRNFCKGIFARS